MKFKQTKYTTGFDISAIVDSDINFSMTIPDTMPTVTEGGRKIVKAGTVFPSNDDQAVGLVRWDYDVTDGSVPGAVMVFGFVNTDKLPAAQQYADIDADAKSAMKGITFWREGGGIWASA